MRVPPLDLKEQYAGLKSEVFSELTRLFDEGNFILGAEVERFEKIIADYLGVKHAVGVTSGTDAIWAALKVLGIGAGDQVLTSPFTFFGTISPILNTGAQPVFADIKADTYNIDPDLVEEVLKKDTHKKIKAVLPVHL